MSRQDWKRVVLLLAFTATLVVSAHYWQRARPERVARLVDPQPRPAPVPDRHGYHIMILHDPDLEREDGVVLGENPPGVWTVEFRYRERKQYDEMVDKVFNKIHENGVKPVPR